MKYQEQSHTLVEKMSQIQRIGDLTSSYPRIIVKPELSRFARTHPQLLEEEGEIDPS